MLLNGNWILKGKNKNGEELSIAATVPGCVHTDLQSAGIIGDFYYRKNSAEVQWIENNDYSYEREFFVEKAYEGAYIEFEGLDTYCTVYLNGIKIGEADNMHISHSFCADGVLKSGNNRLSVCFRSPIKETAGLPEREAAFCYERLYTRRIQCTYGWDWVERFVTMGIFRDVHLNFRKNNEIDNAYIYTADINPYSAQLKLSIAIRDYLPNGDGLSISIISPSGKVVYKKERVIIREQLEEYIDIPSPQLWFPHGYGEQPLYTLTLKTASSQKSIEFGIRKITLLQLQDEPGSREEQLCRNIREKEYFKEEDLNANGSGFTVLVNGVKIMCKGADWVPCEPFPSAEAPEKLERILKLAAFGGVNSVRVWGGGIFEQDAFYSCCDRLGILVSQDFLMACGTYPEENTEFIDQLRAEARCAALRLRNHACLCWWTGDNENAVKGDENSTDYDGYLSATLGLEPILKIYDPARRFLPSSPYGGNKFASPTVGTAHNTNFLGAIFEYAKNSDFSDYRQFFSEFITRFSVEQASLGMPFVSSLKRFMTDEDIFGSDTSVSEYHTKNNPCLEVTIFDSIMLMAEKLFGKYKDGADRVLKQQMLQCEWIRLSFELHRRNKWFTSGILYWMLNDCWPAANGWSIIDYYVQPKPAFYSFKRCAKPVLASIYEDDGRLKVNISNDALKAVNGSGKLYLYDFKNNTNALESCFEFSVEENSCADVYEADFGSVFEGTGSSVILICDIETDNGADRAFFVNRRFCDLDISYSAYSVTARGDDFIEVEARELSPYTIIDIPGLEDNCFLLKKGEKRKIAIRNFEK